MALVGVNVAVAKLLANALPVATVLALRCALAALVLLPFVGRAGLRRPGRRVLLNVVLQSALGTVLYNLALMAGVRRTGALEAGLVLATLPAVVALGSWLMLREPLSPRRMVAAVLAVGGMAVLAFGRGEAGNAAWLGDVLVLVAVCGEAGYILLAKANSGRMDVLPAAFWMQVLSAAGLAPFAWPGLDADLLSPGIAGLLVFHSLTASVAAVLLWYAGLRRVPGGVAGVFSGLLPLSAGLAGVLLLNEPLTPAHGGGAALMLLSMTLATVPGRAARAATG